MYRFRRSVECTRVRQYFIYQFLDNPGGVIQRIDVLQANTYLSLRIKDSSSASFIRAFIFF